VSAGPGTGVLRPSPDEEFLDRFGDAIDDRIAETVDDLLDQRRAAGRHRRLPQMLVCVSPVLAALAASVLLHGSPAVWTVWPAAAVMCVTGAWVAAARKS
jgi:hypothetical protein